MVRSQDTISLKVWEDWSDGIGYQRDSQGANGMFYANGLIGMNGELRPAPVITLARGDGTGDNFALETASMTPRYFFEEYLDPVALTNPRLYVLYNTHHQVSAVSGAGTGYISGDTAKFDLDNGTTTFGNYYDLTNANTKYQAGAGNGRDPWGTPIKFNGTWFVPRGDDNNELEVMVAGAGDTWDKAVKPCDHLMIYNSSAASVRRGTSSTTGGAQIWAADLKPDGNLSSYFGVGDVKNRALAVAALGGAMFVLHKDGLYSFNDAGKGGLVWEDYKGWYNPMNQAAMLGWKNGLVIGHPLGLLYFTPGNSPISIGPDGKLEALGIEPQQGPYDTTSPQVSLQNGRYHGVHTVGDYIYCLYQPSLASNVGLIFFGVSKNGDPTDIAWQCLGSCYIGPTAATVGFSNLFVSTIGRSISASYATPTLWVPMTNAASTDHQLGYMHLDNRASPFFSRSEVRDVVTSGDGWMSELVFPDPITLDELIVVAQDMSMSGDGMTTYDEWQFSLIADGQGIDRNISQVVRGNGRQVLPLSRQPAHRVMLHVKWVGSAGTRTKPVPTIKRIELRGRLA